MRKLTVLASIGLAAFLVGCSGLPDPSPQYAQAADHPAPVDPRDRLFDQTHSANFQLGGALESIEASLKKARAIQRGTSNPEVRVRLAEIARDIDSAGRTMADDWGSEPTRADVAAHMDTFQEQRKKSINDAARALRSLADAKDMAERLQSAAPESPEALAELIQLIAVAQDDAKGVLEALGGREEIYY